jgi:type VI secretion system secreted protein Hcp
MKAHDNCQNFTQPPPAGATLPLAALQQSSCWFVVKFLPKSLIWRPQLTTVILREFSDSLETLSSPDFACLKRKQIGENMMAQLVHMTLSVNGADIQGESTASGLAGTTECESFHLGIEVPTSADGYSRKARVQFSPILVRKKIDTVSPITLQALTNNSQINAEFRFFHPTLIGGNEHFYTIIIQNARLNRIDQKSDINQPVNQPSEELSFSYARIIWRHEITKTETTAGNLSVSNIAAISSFANYEIPKVGLEGSLLSPGDSNHLSELLKIENSFQRIVGLVRDKQLTELNKLEQLVVEQDFDGEALLKRLQESQQASSQMMQMLSNLMRANNDAAQKIISVIRG